MGERARRSIAVTLLLVWPPTLFAQNVVPVPANTPQPLSGLTERSYLDLLEMAPSLAYSNSDFDRERKNLNRQKDLQTARLKQEEKVIEKRLDELRKQLKTLNNQRSTDTPAMAENRNRIHCEVLSLEKQLQDKRIERTEGLNVLFDNRLAKVDLLQQWPGRLREIERTILEEKARQRPHGDVADIGFRNLGEGQEKDIKLGQDAIQELKLYRLMPPEVEDEAVNQYVQQVAAKIAANSDLTVPLKVTVLRSEEINAFSLPGGFLYINTGLLNKATSESEVAGVIAHEVAHVTARHGAQLMRRATVAGLMLQLAQVAAALFSGGISNIGTYYALQYGFYGLGMVLSLELLGVSRKFEMEADQLGTQYAWKAGYDPRGFVTFFDAMASEEGYVRSVSFFRTHPPFFDRIVSTMSEIEYLPRKQELVVDTRNFHNFQTKLNEVLARKLPEEPGRPSLDDQPDCEGYDFDTEDTEKTARDLVASGRTRMGEACGVCY